MSELTHTPGPWSLPHFADTDVGCKCGYVFSDSQRGMGAICTVLSGAENESHDVAVANARLIAVAPNLLEALQNLLEKYVGLINSGDAGNWDPEEEKEVIAARTAIAKAKGLKP